MRPGLGVMSGSEGGNGRRIVSRTVMKREEKREWKKGKQQLAHKLSAPRWSTERKKHCAAAALARLVGARLDLFG